MPTALPEGSSPDGEALEVDVGALEAGAPATVGLRRRIRDYAHWHLRNVEKAAGMAPVTENWMRSPTFTATGVVEVQSAALLTVQLKLVFTALTCRVTVKLADAVGCTRRLLNVQATPMGTSELLSAARVVSPTTP